MKSLSIKQPYAELIIQGKKKIELRKWNTKFRGEFFIHSSRIPDEIAMKKFGFENLPFGFLVGKVTLTNVKKYNNEMEHNKDNSLHLASSVWGDYCFIFEKPERIKLIHYKGQLNFFEVKL